MYKKILSYFFIVFGLVVLTASTSRNAMEQIARYRDSEKWWGAYPCLHGDLVSLCYLDFVKKFSSPHINTPIIKPPRPIAQNTALYLHGDSYSYHLHDTDFAGLSAFYPIDRNHGMNYHLDSTKRNILLIEISERYIRSYFGGLQMLDEVCDSMVKKKSIASLYPNTAGHRQYASLLPTFSIDDLFNKYINQNLQANLFNYNFIIPMFEAKAALNYYVFNRASGDVVISNDRNFLFLKETVSKTDIGSSYVPLTDADISWLVNNFNIIYDHYKKSGFSEVYLSMIPNAVSIEQPEGYNNLIPSIQNDPRLKMKVLDIYTAFKNAGEVVYLPGDTHWNEKGRQIWIDMIHQRLSN